ncbi:sigma-70 family RNA polymerase sigma factor [Actinoplanes sp. NPDC049596]|uniref:RNA polymerase sigma factor n=1 Tax=unclassified Actinoplanes TaxID=2626549 RepID=UPI00341C4009
MPETQLNDDFAAWFSDGGSDLLLRSAHGICGRHLYEDIAFEAAGAIYRQWGDARKRHLFKTQTGYVFQVVRNTFLSCLRKAANRPELHQELPGEEDRTFWKKVSEDPGYEVRQAILLLDADEAELVFIRYFLNLTLSATARAMGLKRSEAEKLHTKALDELREILGPEGAG